MLRGPLLTASEREAKLAVGFVLAQPDEARLLALDAGRPALLRPLPPLHGGHFVARLLRRVRPACFVNNSFS